MAGEPTIAGQERLFAAAEPDLAEIAAHVEDSVGKRLLDRKRIQHSLLDRVFRHQLDYGNGARLVFAPGARDALFESRRIPRQVAINHDARVLQVESRAAGIGAQEDRALRAALEQLDLGPATTKVHTPLSRRGMPPSLIRDLCSTCFAAEEPVPQLQRSLDLMDRHRIYIRDASVLAAAEALGCRQAPDPSSLPSLY